MYSSSWTLKKGIFDKFVSVDRSGICQDAPVILPKPTLSGNPFFQPPCALALLLCAWRLFRALGCGEVGEVGYRSSVLMWGRWQAPYFGNLMTWQRHYRRCSWSPHALCRKAERIALDFCSIRSIVTAHWYEPDVGGFCSDFATGNEDKMVVFSHFLKF